MVTRTSSGQRFRSLFLVNRQKLTDPGELSSLLAMTAPAGARLFPGCLFRVEWHRIGIVVPLYLEGPFVPKVRLEPRCQFIRAAPLPPLENAAEFLFSLTAVPPRCTTDWEDGDLEHWFTQALESCATMLEIRCGPHGTIFFGGPDARQSIRTLALSGRIHVTKPALMEKKRRSGFGSHPELGCGLLLLDPG